MTTHRSPVVIQRSRLRRIAQKHAQNSRRPKIAQERTALFLMDSERAFSGVVTPRHCGLRLRPSFLPRWVEPPMAAPLTALMATSYGSDCSRLKTGDRASSPRVAGWLIRPTSQIEAHDPGGLAVLVHLEPHPEPRKIVQRGGVLITRAVVASSESSFCAGWWAASASLRRFKWRSASPKATLALATSGDSSTTTFITSSASSECPRR